MDDDDKEGKIAKRPVHRPKKAKPKEEDGEGLHKSFFGHLEDLRKAVLHSVIAVGGIAFFFFTFGIAWFDFKGYSIPYPYFTLSDNLASKVFLRMKSDLLPPGIKMIALSPTDALTANIEVAIFVGVVLGSVVIIREVVVFVTPALTAKEKRITGWFVVSGFILFILGCWLSYVWITPFSFTFLYYFAGSMQVDKYISVSDFVNFSLVLILSVGVVFEMPIIMYCITLTGLVDAHFWAEHWRIALLVMLIVAGIITPDTTGVTQILLTIPMGLLYLIGWGASRSIDKKDVGSLGRRFKEPGD